MDNFARSNAFFRHLPGHTSQRASYHTSLATQPAAALAAGIRGQKGIENKLHRIRGVPFGQPAPSQYPGLKLNVKQFNSAVGG